jgi:glycosyltransferase involved in cell wall biosynthesis
MIVKNEERFIERVLACARPLCDEMIVVDTGSTDRTIEIAERMGAKVFRFAWTNDFSAARNASFERATGDWILWLDADDVISPASQQAILALKANGLSDAIDVVEATYQIAFDETGRCVEGVVRERLFRRGAGLKWKNVLHEFVAHDPARTLYRPDILIEHREDRSLRPVKREKYKQMLRTSLDGANPFPLAAFYYANELFNERHLQEAAEYYALSIERDRNEPTVYNTMVQYSTCLRELGKPEEALAWAEQALAFDGTRAEALVRIAFYHFDRQEWEAAIRFFTSASMLHRPDLPYVQDRDYTWLPLDYISLCHYHLGNFQQAAEFCLRAIAYKTELERLKKNLIEIIARL